MSLTNLSIIILVATVTMFVTSILARRAGTNNPTLDFIVKALRVAVLLLVAVYFYKRFAG